MAAGPVDQEALARAQARAQAEMAKLGGDQAQPSQLTPSQQTALNIGHGMTGSLGTEYLFPAANKAWHAVGLGKGEPMTASDFDREVELQKQKPGFQATGEEALGFAAPFILGAGPYRRGLEIAESAAATPKIMKAAATGALSTRALPQLAHGTGMFMLRDLLLNKAPEQASGAEERTPGEIAGGAAVEGGKEGIANLLFGKALQHVVSPALSKIGSLADEYAPAIRARATELIEQARKLGINLSGDQAAQQAAREAGTTSQAGHADVVRQEVSNEAKRGSQGGDIAAFQTRQSGAIDAAKAKVDAEVDRILKTKSGAKQYDKDLTGTTVPGTDQDVVFQTAKILNDVKATMPSGVKPNSPEHYMAAMEEAGRRVAAARNPAERAAAQANIDHLQNVLLQETPRVAEASGMRVGAARAEEAATPYPKPEKEAKPKTGYRLGDLLIGAAGIPSAVQTGSLGHAALSAGGALAMPAVRAGIRAGREAAGGLGRGGALDINLNDAPKFVQNLGRFGDPTTATARAAGTTAGTAAPAGILEMLPDVIRENFVDPLSYLYKAATGASDETPEEKLARRKKGRGQ